MRNQHFISHLLYALAELAFAALLAGCLDAVWHQGGFLMVCGAVASACLLAATITLHLVRASAARQARGAKHATASVTADTPAAAQTPAEAPANTQALVASPENTALAPSSITTTPQQVAPDVPGEATALEYSPKNPSLPVSAGPLSNLKLHLEQAQDPLGELKHVVGTIRTHEAEQQLETHDAPSELERYAARMLDEAGLFESDPALPHLQAYTMEESGMVRLEVTDAEQLPYPARMRLLRLEAAINAIVLAVTTLPADASLQDAYQLNQGLARSIVGQAAPIDDTPLEPIGAEAGGEWAVRYGISQAIETLRLPYRLSVRFRTNVADGNVAMEVELPPAEVFPASCYLDGLGLVPTSGDMRQRAAADYALRLALLLAACAFRCSRQLKHVWVAGIINKGTHRTCYYCVDFDRYRFAKLDLANLGSLSETYRSFAPLMRYEDGWLRPVKQSFHLEEERFCPSRRYVPVSLSSRKLAGGVAERLGTDHVSGLAIEEADGRSAVAGAIMRRLVPEQDERATQKNVRTIMELAGDDPDPTVRNAAERVINAFIDGSLDMNPLSVGEEFVRGDALTRATDRGKLFLMKQQPAEAGAAIEPVIAAIDRAGMYDDTSTISYRYFSSYVERALYNRLYAEKERGRSIILVPDAYYEAHLILSVVQLMAGNPQGALVHAERLVALAPLDARARLHLVKCLEELDRVDEAVGELCQLLEEAHEPQGLGFGYYRMAAFQWMRGNIDAARACYQRSMELLPTAVPFVSMELTVLALQNPELMQDTPSDDEIDEVLTAHNIPVAPTNHTAEVFYECAQASVDAEIFPVARNFAYLLGAFAGGDEVLSGLIRSIEDAPDR